MSDTPQTINGELLRLKRESLGWLISDLATRACMSIKQIKQLEEGGSSSFYSESVKLTSAKKVGSILGLTQDEVFGVVTQEPEVATQDADAMVAEMVSDTPAQGVMSHTDEPSSAANITELTTDAPQVQSESQMPSASSPEVTVAPGQNAAVPVTEQKNKTPLGAIAALFVAALAVAAWMRPESEPVAVEPPPPLQTLPADTPDGAASAASAEAAATPASAASSASSSASAASPAVTPALPQASAAPVAPKASAVPAAPPASSSASKPL